MIKLQGWKMCLIKGVKNLVLSNDLQLVKVE